jgi:zinc protease
VKKFRIALLSFLICSLLLVCLPPGDLQAMPPVRKVVLPNKMVVLHSEDHSLPFVTMRLLIDGGSRSDSAGQEGLARLAAKGLLLGTSKHNREAINEALDFMGASLDASSGRDYSTVSLRFLKKDLDDALALFMEVLTRPAYPVDEIKREVDKTLAAIQAQEDEPGEVAEKEFRETLFPGSPYGHPVIGTKESLPKITREAILNYYKAHYHPNNYILSIVGDITSGEVKTKILSLFENISAVDLSEVPFKSSFAGGPETKKINREISQANIIIGNKGISRGNPDYYAVSVMNYILGGGGFASRLLEEIRNKRGLAYSVESFFDPGKYPGSFQIVLQTKNRSAREAISLAIGQMKLIRKEPVSSKELDGAKKYFIGSFPLRLDTQGKLAKFLVQVQYYGLGLDYPEKYRSLISSVTKEQLMKVANKYLHPENCILVVVANLKEAGMEATAKDPSQETTPQRSVVQSNLGITVEALSPQLRRQYNIRDKQGVVVINVRPDSPADSSGMCAGDLIKKIDRRPITDMKDFNSAMEYWDIGKNIEFLLKRGGKTLYIVIGTDRNKI